MNVRDKLLTENPWKLMVNLSLPAILGQLIVGLYSFVDSIYPNFFAVAILNTA